jgi:hypothetical protein
MCKPNVAVEGATGSSITVLQFLLPAARGMSHNGRTPQGVGVWPASIPRERELARQIGGPGVSYGSAGTRLERSRTDGD